MKKIRDFLKMLHREKEILEIILKALLVIIFTMFLVYVSIPYTVHNIWVVIIGCIMFEVIIISIDIYVNKVEIFQLMEKNNIIKVILSFDCIWDDLLSGIFGVILLITIDKKILFILLFISIVICRMFVPKKISRFFQQRLDY